jgi:DNA modification methylase
MKNKILCGDSLEVLKDFEDNYFDSVVTDPPYGLAFMGKKWDYDVPQVELWKEVYRVLKPGGHLLSFAGSRTYHRMAVNIEDAGFEIRDMLGWLYGSGFPKSHNIGKAVDKLDAKELRIKRKVKFTKWLKSTGVTVNDLNKELRKNNLITEKSSGASHFLDIKSQPAIPTLEMFNCFKHLIPKPPKEIMNLILERTVESENFKNRKVVGKKTSGIGTAFGEGEWKSGKAEEVDITIPKTEQAKLYEGWGTALKPAHEPIVMARKPFNTSVAENVLTHGTGGINIDECRIPYKSKDDMEIRTNLERDVNKLGDGNFGGGKYSQPVESGRFPANIIHDGSEEVLEVFEESSRFFYCAKASKAERNIGLDDLSTKQTTGGGGGIGNYLDDINSASGKYGSEKAPQKNYHPTVKPIKLMEYLVRLVTPKEGIVLEPFAGSGTTLIACKQQGFNYIGIEREQEYCDIAEARLKGVQIQGQLF